MNYAQIKSLLKTIDDPVIRLEVVMDLGMQSTPGPRSCAHTRISGCASNVEICKHNGRFYGMADSALVAGIVAIILAMANDGIRDLRGEFASLNLNLGAGRLSGVDSIIKYIQGVI